MNLISINSYLLIGMILFLTGLYTTISRKNILGIFMGLELILNAAALNFAAFSSFSAENLEGQIFSIFIIVLAAAEAAVALALLLALYSKYKDINADEINILKG